MRRKLYHYSKMPPIVFLIVMMLITFLTGCSVIDMKPAPSDNEEEKSIAAYLPLSVGNYWSYEGIGNEYATYTEKVTHQKDKKYQVIVDNGGTVTANRYEVTDSSIVNTLRQPEFYEDKNILDSPVNYHAVLLQSPLTLGNTWESEGNTCEIVDTMATVDVPAGTFENCLAIKITFVDSGNISYYYYKKGVGMVKTEYVMPGNDSIISQLKEYSLNP